MKRWILISLLLWAGPGAAQMPASETPPNEPPYTNIEEEFDQAAQAGGTTPLRAGDEAPAVIEAPAPVVAAPSPAAEPLVRQTRTDGKHTYVQHPDAKKGLKLIDRDGSYIYAPTRFGKREQTASFRFGQLNPTPGIVSADGVTTYSAMYGSAQPSVLSFEYEWKPWTSFGDIGLQLGVGFFTATGSGRFNCDDGACSDITQAGERTALEKYTFYAFPLTVGGIYRFQYMDGQWISPYIAGGMTYYALLELRDDNKPPNGVGTPSVYGAGGLMFNLSAIDKDMGFQMDAEYGISTLWLSLEARQIEATNKDIDLGGTLFSLGISADY